MTADRTELTERFAGDDLDLDVWCSSYLPHWSSRAASAATYLVANGELRLSIPPEQALWCPDEHPEPLRVSCIQSGNYSGRVGSTDGPQPFKDGLVVREQQPTMWGYTPTYGHLEVRMRGVVTARSMVAFWLSGIEDRPERSGEICVAEIFGSSVRAGLAEVGMGIHQFRDPGLREEFSAESIAIDVGEFHTYAVDWTPGGLVFSIDGEEIRRSPQAPAYPMQLMLGVFDFPTQADARDPIPTAELIVSQVIGRPA